MLDGDGVVLMLPCFVVALMLLPVIVWNVAVAYRQDRTEDVRGRGRGSTVRFFFQSGLPL